MLKFKLYKGFFVFSTILICIMLNSVAFATTTVYDFNTATNDFCDGNMVFITSANIENGALALTDASKSWGYRNSKTYKNNRFTIKFKQSTVNSTFRFSSRMNGFWGDSSYSLKSTLGANNKYSVVISKVDAGTTYTNLESNAFASFSKATGQTGYSNVVNPNDWQTMVVEIYNRDSNSDGIDDEANIIVYINDQFVVMAKDAALTYNVDGRFGYAATGGKILIDEIMVDNISAADSSMQKIIWKGVNDNYYGSIIHLIYNTAPADKPISLICARYTDNTYTTIDKIVIKGFTAKTNDWSGIAPGVNSDFVWFSNSSNFPAGSYTKLFIWDNLTNLKPLHKEIKRQIP